MLTRAADNGQVAGGRLSPSSLANPPFRQPPSTAPSILATRKIRQAAKGREGHAGKGDGGNVKYLLLIAPCLLAIAVPLFNSDAPELFGVPFFYWFQMLIVPVSALCIWAADRMGRV